MKGAFSYVRKKPKHYVFYAFGSSIAWNQVNNFETSSHNRSIDDNKSNNDDNKSYYDNKSNDDNKKVDKDRKFNQMMSFIKRNNLDLESHYSLNSWELRVVKLGFFWRC